ncbi:unnamed protein product [Haemonchus placei]|uniref:Uncharacterized protein n=1 Tax=Haemonchus placei TaxID=6290 RepID=A0A0N4WNR2_HAEPC|nr:unnamed protein product [Haemonchus placei]
MFKSSSLLLGQKLLEVPGLRGFCGMRPVDSIVKMGFFSFTFIKLGVSGAECCRW